MEHDFGGYATKANILCTDGRTILPDAFAHQDGMRVPLVWEHGRSDPENMLGYAILDKRPDGVYTRAFFNSSPKAAAAKTAVEHGDINALSIFATKLKQVGKAVLDGAIQEVSLVLGGANSGAKIDYVAFQHGDGFDVDFEEAIISMGLDLELSHADTDTEETVEDIFNTLTDKQKDVVFAMISDALGEGEDDDTEDEESDNLENSDTEGNSDMANVFEGTENDNHGGSTLSHSQIKTVLDSAVQMGSLKEAVLQHAGTWGINDIELLFPEAKNIRNTPDLIKRRSEWVARVWNGVSKTPFSRIKSMSADLTYDTARARGFIKGNMKKEQFFGIARRITTPFTVYTKQKLDRDDIIDITDFDVVAWMKAIMRIQFEEEVSRALLLGDGREVEDPDKINETNIRPIAKDDDFYAHRVNVAANTAANDLVETVLRNRKNYKGSGSPTFFTTEDVLTDMLLAKDKIGRRLYRTVQELAAELRVSDIVPVEPMEGHVDDDGHELLAIMVNLTDYTAGADRGGQTAFFDNFDIDYNTYKYLYEGRLSGALTMPKSALVFWRGAGTLATPTAPTFNSGTNTITIPTVTGVTYTIDDETVTGSVVITEDTFVEAVPAEGYYFPAGTDNDWAFTYKV